jgi:hypothetical protein
VVPPYRLYWVLRELEELELRKDDLKAVGELNDAAFKCLETVNRIEPKWLDGNIALALEHAQRGRKTPDRDIFGTLLPHGWLWIYDGSQEQQLDWRALRAEYLKNDLTWEHEFDDVHVLSLLTLAQVFARIPAPPPPKLFTVIRQRLRRESTWDRTPKILAHIQRHYYPDDVELLRLLRATTLGGPLKARAAPGNRNSLRNMAKLWLSDDSVTYRVLKGLAQIICRAGRSDDEELGALDELITELWTFPNRARSCSRGPMCRWSMLCWPRRPLPGWCHRFATAMDGQQRSPELCQGRHEVRHLIVGVQVAGIREPARVRAPQICSGCGPTTVTELLKATLNAPTPRNATILGRNRQPVLLRCAAPRRDAARRRRIHRPGPWPCEPDAAGGRGHAPRWRAGLEL